MKRTLLTILTLGLLLGSPMSWAKTGAALQGVVNINEASVTELMLLPGIGEAKALAIVEARKVKAFATKEDILNVKGIGENILASFQDHVAFSGKTTLQEIQN